MSLECDSPNLEKLVECKSGNNHVIMSGEDNVEEQAERTSIELNQVQFINNDLEEPQEEVMPTEFNESQIETVELEQKNIKADSSADDDHSPPTANITSGQSHKDISLERVSDGAKSCSPSEVSAPSIQHQRMAATFKPVSPQMDIQQQSGLPNYPPYPFPHFYSNPFMAPYMPQAGLMSSTTPDAISPPMIGGGSEAAYGADSELGTNPMSSEQMYRAANPYTTPGFYISPSQYQEMMQTYLQGLLQAAGFPLPGQRPVGPIGMSPVSEPGEVVYDDTAEATEALAKAKLAGGVRSMPQFPYPYYNMVVQQPPVPKLLEQYTENERKPLQSSSVDQSNVQSIQSAVDQNELPTCVATDGSDTQRMASTPPSQPFSFASPATSISSSRQDSLMPSLENSPAKPGQQDRLPHLEDGLSSQSDSDVESKGQRSATDKENPTAQLIKKQMHEIEKEINRRIANQNVLKVDPKELEVLLCEKRQHEEELARFQEERMRRHQAAKNGNSESVIPWTEAPQEISTAQFESAKDGRSLNELSTPNTTTSESVYQQAVQNDGSQFYQAHFPQASMTGFALQQQSLAQAQMYPSSVQPSFMPTPPRPSSFGSPGTGPLAPHYAAALLQQMQSARPPTNAMPIMSEQINSSPVVQQVRQPHQPWINGAQNVTPQNSWPTAPEPPLKKTDETVTTGHTTVEPPKKERWSGANGYKSDQNVVNELSNNYQNDQQPNEMQNVAQNNEEPVWVMRQSYLDKMKREEDRRIKLEHKEHQQALVQADKETGDSDTDSETNRLLGDLRNGQAVTDQTANSTGTKPKKKEVMVHEPAVLIEGVLFRARYLGSTQLYCEGRPTKATRMMQAQEAVTRIKATDGEAQPRTDVDLFISTEKIMVLNTDLQRISDTDVRQDIMMDHPLRTISYIADIGDVVVLMARRMTQSSSPDQSDEQIIKRTPKVICHLFESDESQFIAQSIGQAFQVAYIEFLRANGIDDPGYLREIDYQEVLNSQEIFGDEIELFSSKEMQKDIVVPKQKGEQLGVVVVESGWGSMLPTVVVANLMPAGPAARSNVLNIGDQIIAINGISLVGLPLSACQQNIKNAKHQTAVKLTVVSTPPVVEVRIKRPDSKYQLGFSVQNGVICSLLRGGIAERGGVRVGHRIIEINGQSVVAVAHEKIVNMLATAVGEIQMKTMPTSMFRLLTGQEQPNYI